MNGIVKKGTTYSYLKGNHVVRTRYTLRVGNITAAVSLPTKNPMICTAMIQFGWNNFRNFTHKYYTYCKPVIFVFRLPNQIARVSRPSWMAEARLGCRGQGWAGASLLTCGVRKTKIQHLFIQDTYQVFTNPVVWTTGKSLTATVSVFLKFWILNVPRAILVAHQLYSTYS